MKQEINSKCTSLCKFYITVIDIFRQIKPFFYFLKKIQKSQLIYNKKRDSEHLSERSLAFYYGVNPDTIEKWITYFSKDCLVFAYKCSQKKINEMFEQKIIRLFGKPTQKEDIVNKDKLVTKLCEVNGKSRKTNYRNLKEIILRKFPNMKDFYSKIDFFPPLVANKILEVI